MDKDKLKSKALSFLSLTKTKIIETIKANNKIIDSLNDTTGDTDDNSANSNSNIPCGGSGSSDASK